MAAQRDFNKALRGARLRKFWNNLTGRNDGLIPFNYVQDIVEWTNQRYRGIQAVPLEHIIGSLDRSGDFDRIFSPTQIHSRSKWLSIDRANLTGVYLPPIKVYKVGEAFFVVDGHHRVSVARHLGQAFIDAEVTEVESRVPVTADLRLEDLDLLGPYNDFISATGLDKLRPQARIQVTRPDYYPRLLEHIRVHQYYLELERKQPVSWDDAVQDWYDRIYLPIVRAIRQHKLTRDFPRQSETDLYLWVIDHAYYLTKRFGQNIRPSQAALDFAARFSKRPARVFQRALVALREWLLPDTIEPGPRAGNFRTERVQPDSAASLFHDILVTVTGAETGWLALSQAADFARRENSTLHGLHVLTQDNPQTRAHAQAVMEEFAFRCQSMGVRYTTSIETGEVADVIIERARWADLVVINQRREHGQWADRPLGTIFHQVVEKSARPILAVPGTSVNVPHKILLAYDGSPKAREALFITRELIIRWKVEAVIVTVASARTNREMLDSAWNYANQAGQAAITAIYETGVPEEIILRLMREQGACLLIMGGYGYTPLLKAFFGSTVDRVLREAWFPVLICR